MKLEFSKFNYQSITAFSTSKPDGGLEFYLPLNNKEKVEHMVEDICSRLQDVVKERVLSIDAPDHFFKESYTKIVDKDDYEESNLFFSHFLLRLSLDVLKDLRTFIRDYIDTKEYELLLKSIKTNVISSDVSGNMTLTYRITFINPSDYNETFKAGVMEKIMTFYFRK